MGSGMSTPAKHTPWKVQPNLSFGPAWEVADSTGSVIAACAEKATAHMIAAAPTMLEALKLAKTIIGHPDDEGSKFIADVIALASPVLEREE